MSSIRYSKEFRDQAIRLVEEEKQSVADVAKKLNVSTFSLYKWLRTQKVQSSEQSRHSSLLEKEVLSLKENLQEVIQERNILKKAQAYFKFPQD